jgi:hydroxypyruvate isomerase
VVSSSVFGTLVEDELVKRRAGELEAAKLQEHARTAAEQGNWGKVDALLKQAVALGVDNPWVAGVVGELSQLAKRRDQMTFMKEAAYSSTRMRGRMTAVNEKVESLMDAPLFLRRKMSQGKAAPEDTPTP